MIDVRHETLLSRLSVIARPAGQSVLDGIDLWNTEHGLESRADQTKRTRWGFVYDAAYGRLRRLAAPVFDVQGREHEKYAVLCDEGAPLAIWIKAVRRRSLLTSNNWSSRRTKAVRRDSRLSDRPGKPEFVYLSYTTVMDPVLHQVTVEDMYFTRETHITSDQTTRRVVKVMHIYNMVSGWLLAESDAGQGYLFSAPEIVVPVVKVRIRPPTVVPASPVVGIEPAKRAEEAKAADGEAATKRRRKGRTGA